MDSRIRYADVSRMREKTLQMFGEEVYNGNAVRKVETVSESLSAPAPAITPKAVPTKKDIERKKRQKRIDRAANREHRIAYRNREEATTMGAGFTFVLAVAAVLTVLLCVRYLSVQAEIIEKSEYVSQLKNKVTVMTTQNDAVEYSINSQVNLDEIYRVATEELGMIIATENQVKLYESSDLEYIKQFGDIPQQ